VTQLSQGPIYYIETRAAAFGYDAMFFFKKFPNFNAQDKNSSKWSSALKFLDGACSKLAGMFFLRGSWWVCHRRMSLNLRRRAAQGRRKRKKECREKGRLGLGPTFAGCKRAAPRVRRFLQRKS